MLTLILIACAPQGEPAGEPPRSNVPPAITSVVLSPDPAWAADEIVATVDAFDIDGDEISLRYAWYIDGEEQSNTEDTLPAYSASHYQTVEVSVSISDGFAFGTPGGAELTIENTAPVATGVAISPGAPTVTDTLTCEASYSDDDGDEVTWTYTWYVGGASVQSGDDATLSGAFSKGQSVACEVTADDGDLTSPALRSDDVEVVNSPPGAPEIGFTPDPPSPCLEGEGWIAAESDDADGDAISYAWAFYDAGGAEVLTSATWPAETFVEGESYTAIVTPNDGEDDGTAAEVSFVASGGGEQLGNDIDDDCDGAVDEWIEGAWQAQQMYWGEGDNEQLGYGVGAGDIDGDGRAELALIRGGEAEVLIVMGASMDPEVPRIRDPDVVLSGATSTVHLLVDDSDGDGQGDLYVGAPGYDGSAGSNSGGVFLLDAAGLSDGALEDRAGWWIEGDDNDQDVGRSFGVGDLDGDGAAEVIVAHLEADAASRDSGEVYVFYGASGGALSDADAALQGTNREVYFGSAIAVVPDLDGDGYPELAVGGPGADDGETDGGLVAVWFGGASRIGSEAYDGADLLIVGDIEDAAVGSEPAASGDVDGDGLADLAVVHRGDGAVSSPGTIALFSGADLSAGGSFAIGDAFGSVASEQSSGGLGVDGTGPAMADVDGDGLADLAAGAAGEGALYMWRSGTLAAGGELTTADADVQIAQEESGDQFSRASVAADTDGDGRPDLIASGWRSDVGGNTAGAAYVFRPVYDEAADLWAPACDDVGDLIYCRESLSWADARLACQIYGGDLARLDSDSLSGEAGAAAADRAIPGSERGLWWIGLSQASGQWAWLDDADPATFTSWGNGSPGGEGDCAVTNQAGEGLWADADCEDAHFFICAL